MTRHYDLATRAQAITLKIFGATYKQIQQQTGIQRRTLLQIYTRAVERGFDPKAEHSIIRDIYVQDAPHSDRPSKQTEDKKEKILNKVRLNHYDREKTCIYIANEIGDISPMTVWRILRKSSLKKIKPTRKPDLTQKMKADRLEFCYRHEH